MSSATPKTLKELLASAKKAKTLAELYAAHEEVKDQAKALYDVADVTLKKLVRVWKKNKKAAVDEDHFLAIEDQFLGQTKAFAPGFAHRYKMKLRPLHEPAE